MIHNIGQRFKISKYATVLRVDFTYFYGLYLSNLPFGLFLVSGCGCA